MCRLEFIFAPVGFRWFSETTGYFQKEEKREDFEAISKDRESLEIASVEKDTTIGEWMVITVSSANIRTGPSTNYDIVATAKNGDVFMATGNQKTALNGQIWYEIYLDDDMSRTGWASKIVIAFQ